LSLPPLRWRELRRRSYENTIGPMVGASLLKTGEPAMEDQPQREKEQHI